MIIIDKIKIVSEFLFKTESGYSFLFWFFCVFIIPLMYVFFIDGNTSEYITYNIESKHISYDDNEVVYNFNLVSMDSTNKVTQKVDEDVYNEISEVYVRTEFTRIGEIFGVSLFFLFLFFIFLSYHQILE